MIRIRMMRGVRFAVALLVPISICAIAAIIVNTSAVGICAAIWRYDAIDSLIGPTSNRSHPVTWIFPCLHILGFLFMLPGEIAFHLTLINFVPWFDPTISGVALTRNSLRWKLFRWERRCAVAWGRLVRAEIERLKRRRRPQESAKVCQTGVGSRKVILRPDGSKLLTNPSAMAKKPPAFETGDLADGSATQNYLRRQIAGVASWAYARYQQYYDSGWWEAERELWRGDATIYGSAGLRRGDLFRRRSGYGPSRPVAGCVADVSYDEQWSALRRCAERWRL